MGYLCASMLVSGVDYLKAPVDEHFWVDGGRAHWKSTSDAPAKALQIATINAARVLEQEAELGSIAPRKRADLLLVEGNPAEHIGDIRRCRMVLKNGTLYDSAAVYAAAGIKPAE
jgi:cytosine/adenosine deaminase-related metal-dependent hydrolase